MNSVLEFEVGVTRSCINISTVSDLTYEEDETVLILLSPTQASVFVSVNSSTVLIEDNDSECLQ